MLSVVGGNLQTEFLAYVNYLIIVAYVKGTSPLGVMVLPSTSYIYATTANQEISENITNASNITENTTDLQNTSIIQSTTAGNSSNGTAVSDAVKNQYTVNSTNSDTNSSNDSVNSNVSGTNQSSEAAGDESYNNVHGIWLSTYDVTKISADELIKNGITDVFVKTNRIKDPTYKSILQTILSKLSGTGIRVHDPKILFLDEPTANLDPEASKIVRDFILELKKEDRTIFLNTHLLSEAGKICDRLGIIKTKLLAVDTPQRLIQSLGSKKTVIQLEQVNNTIVRAVEKLESGKVEVTRNKLFIEVKDPEKENPDILKAIINAGGRVQLVSDVSPTLEDAYLKFVRSVE